MDESRPNSYTKAEWYVHDRVAICRGWCTHCSTATRPERISAETGDSADASCTDSSVSVSVKLPRAYQRLGETRSGPRDGRNEERIEVPEPRSRRLAAQKGNAGAIADPEGKCGVDPLCIAASCDPLTQARWRQGSTDWLIWRVNCRGTPGAMDSYAVTGPQCMKVKPARNGRRLS